MAENIIIGAGIAGISAGYHLKLIKKESIIYEQNDRYGGLCDNFEIEGFRFDKAVHFSLTNNDYVKTLFAQSSKYYSHPPKPVNYYNGYWIKHPAQNNLFPLPVPEKVSIIRDFIQNENPRENIVNYEMWLRMQYGNSFAENFPMKYTRKYWTRNARDLTASWVGEKMYMPDLREILYGAMTDDTPNTYYANEMRYPHKGGFKSFITKMALDCEIKLNKKAVEINPENKTILFDDGTSDYYENLISSIPLPEIVKIIKDVPEKVKEAAKNLDVTSVALVSLGFKRENIARHLWFYIYDEDFLPARCYSPSLKSPDNAPKGTSSLQFEIYFSKKSPLPILGERLIEHVVEKSMKIGLFTKDDIVVWDNRVLPFGNVIFDHDMEKNRKIVHNYLDKVKIKYIGRFGEWGYLWTDQSLLSGKNAVEDIYREYL